MTGTFAVSTNCNKICWYPTELPRDTVPLPLPPTLLGVNFSGFGPAIRVSLLLLLREKHNTVAVVDLPKMFVVSIIVAVFFLPLLLLFVFAIFCCCLMLAFLVVCCFFLLFVLFLLPLLRSIVISGVVVVVVIVASVLGRYPLKNPIFTKCWCSFSCYLCCFSCYLCCFFLLIAIMGDFCATPKNNPTIFVEFFLTRRDFVLPCLRRSLCLHFLCCWRWGPTPRSLTSRLHHVNHTFLCP